MPVSSEAEYTLQSGAVELPLEKLFASLAVEDKDKEEWKITKFETTPIVSTFPREWDVY